MRDASTVNSIAVTVSDRGCAHQTPPVWYQ
jgi:hypothetical protein